jgi:hypothetical protein
LRTGERTTENRAAVAKTEGQKLGIPTMVRSKRKARRSTPVASSSNNDQQENTGSLSLSLSQFVPPFLL